MYNKTDGAGWCFTAYCSVNCSVEKLARPCQPPVPPINATTTTSSGTTTRVGSTTPSTIPVTTLKPFKDCLYLQPPRKVFKFSFFLSVRSVLQFPKSSQTDYVLY